MGREALIVAFLASAGWGAIRPAPLAADASFRRYYRLIDGDRQAVPDGSSFAWQHWSHTFSYALTSSGAAGGWREAGFNAAAEEYNHDLTAVVTGPTALADEAEGRHADN